MRRIQHLRTTLAATLVCGLLTIGCQLPALADSANAPSLVISQLKITSSSGQFITLYNPTNTTLDMSKYQLEYFNSYDLAKATSSKLIGLSGNLPPHGYFMVNDSALLLCYQLTIDSVSLGLSSTAGLVEVLAFNQSSPGSSVAPMLQDFVGWSKTAASGAQTLPANTNAFLHRQPVDTRNNPAINSPGVGSWQTVQPDPSNACNLVSATGPSAKVSTGLSQLLPSTEPPATIIATDAANVAPGVGLPSADIGLMAPAITELLPNPDGSGNDATDEFVELYNPNLVSFDLSGFSLEAGTTTLHSFAFPAGASLPAKSFVAFYSADTGLSLSNSGGQVKLLDPNGNSISTSSSYATASDGQAWALAKGSWYWTTNITPAAANVIIQPAPKKKTAAKGTHVSTKISTGKVKGATTKATKSTKPATAYAAETTSPTPIHPWTLALIAGLALLYGAYEYRADLANRIHQLRRYLGTRRADRP